MNEKNGTPQFEFLQLKPMAMQGYRSARIFLDPEKVFRTCLEETGATVAEVRGPRGNENVVWKRHIVHYFLDRYCSQYPQVELLKITGRKSNNAMVNSSCQVRNRCDVEKDFKSTIDRITLKLERLKDE